MSYIKFDCLFLAIFKSFYWFVSFIFDKLASWIYGSKDALNHVLVHSSPKTSLRNAKNVVLFLFCILVDRPMGGGGQKPPPPSSLGCATHTE